MKNQFVFLLLLTIVFALPAQAQADQDEVREVINRLFNGMENGDSAKVHSAFATQITMSTIARDKNNAPNQQAAGLDTIQHPSAYSNAVFRQGASDGKSEEHSGWSSCRQRENTRYEQDHSHIDQSFGIVLVARPTVSMPNGQNLHDSAIS